MFFANLTKEIDIILIHSYRMAIAVLAVVIFVFNKNEPIEALTSFPLEINRVCFACFEFLAASQLKIAG